MALITNEIPVGAIDGVNKIYTFANNINTLDDLWVDGAIYTAFSITGTNEITLVDAPNLNIFADYWTAAPTGVSNFITVLEARTLLERHIDDDLPNVSSQLFLDWINALNRFTYRKLFGTDHTQFVQLTNINVLEGTSTYGVPGDFKNIKVSQTGIFETDTNGNATNKRLKPTTIGSSLNGYYFQQGQLILTPTPSTDYTLKMYYIPRLNKLLLDADNTVIDEEYQDYLIKALKISYYDFANDQGNEVFTDQKFSRLLTEYLQDFRPTPQVYKR